MPLVEYFIGKLNQKTGRHIVGLTPAAKDILINYPWPGNVRELEHVIERGMVLTRGDVIDASDLPEFKVQEKGAEYPADIPLKDVEKRHILRVLEKTKGSMNQTAEILGIHRNTLRLKMKEYDINLD
jgi:two-component system response regulator HydG